jgi:hypothetical protein
MGFASDVFVCLFLYSTRVLERRLSSALVRAKMFGEACQITASKELRAQTKSAGDVTQLRVVMGVRSRKRWFR